ncbi:MAG: lytic transglycosylase domain-containing protein [Caulobacterales bacterium]|nr:lytic transglycosylase domain-containing protein [Caulobacterales bacterium]
MTKTEPRRARLATMLIALASTLAPAAHAATEPFPRLKPTPVFTSELLEADQFAALRAGMQAADDARWSQVRRSMDTVVDPAADNLLLWRRAVGDPAMSFAEMRAALDVLVEWPRYRQIQAEAESRIASAGLSSAAIAAWFETRPPRSGVGKAAFAEALIAIGRDEEGEAVLGELWRGSTLPLSEQSRLLSRHGRRLTTADHVARVDFLLWSGQRTASRRLLSKLPSGERHLATARLKLMGRERGVDSAIARVPNALREHPGLLYERARWRRGARRTAAALPLILDIPADAGPGVARRKVWTERRIHIRRALKDGDAPTAYQLASNSGLASGASFAEAEWLAGWLALRRLDDIDTAEAHFATLESGVTTPISLARAAFWRGRAAEAAGKASTARTHYKRAAAHTTAYYGQLAATQLSGTAAVASLPPEAQPSRLERQAFNSRQLPRAVTLLAELDELTLFREFAFHLDDQLERPAEFALLAEIAREYGQTGVATRHGKAALARGLVEPGTAYPLIDLPPLPPDAPEEALLLALIRQESEFYPKAISPVGARGMMQLMPSTARSTARSIGRSYRRNWLIDDIDYNIEIGSAHLADLLVDFDGSYVLAAAAYNAGSSRARRWINDYGDPRSGAVDPIDWVESIPFSETRNYVQRVMENLQIYRARLADGAVPITLPQDLARDTRRS